MPRFIVEQYELYMTKNEIEADSPAEAVKLMLEATPPRADRDDCSEFLEVADQYGLTADRNPQLVQQLRELDVVINDIIPSIRQVYPLHEQ